MKDSEKKYCSIFPKIFFAQYTRIHQLMLKMHKMNILILTQKKSLLHIVKLFLWSLVCWVKFFVYLFQQLRFCSQKIKQLIFFKSKFHYMFQKFVITSLVALSLFKMQDPG